MSRSNTPNFNDRSIDLKRRWFEEYQYLESELMQNSAAISIKAQEVVDEIRPHILQFGELLMMDDSQGYKMELLKIKDVFSKIGRELNQAGQSHVFEPIEMFLIQCQKTMDTLLSRGNFFVLPSEMLLNISEELSPRSLSALQRTNRFHHQFFWKSMKQLQLPHRLKIFCGPNQTFLLYNGVILASGSNACGELGLNLETYKKSEFFLPPFFLNDPTDEVVDIALGEKHILFLTKLGKVYVCGGNEFGQCGVENRSGSVLFSEITFPSRVIRISTLGWHSLFLTEGGEVYGCGYDCMGQLSGNYQGSGYQTPKKIDFPFSPFGSRVTDIAAGMAHSVFLTERDVYICGEMITNVHTIHKLRRLLLPTETLNDSVIKVYVGVMNTFLLTNNGRIFACGNNQKGQLGTGDKHDRSALTLVFDHPKDPAVDLRIADGRSFVITRSGALYGSGDLKLGELPHSRTFCEIPLAFDDVNDRVMQVAAGFGHTALLTHSGDLQVSGNNDQGEIGLGSLSDQECFKKLFNAQQILKLMAHKSEEPQRRAVLSLQ